MGKEITLKIVGNRVVERERKDKDSIVGTKTLFDIDSIGKKPKDQIPNLLTVMMHVLDEVDKVKLLGTSAYDKSVEALEKASEAIAKVEGKDIGFENSLTGEVTDTPVLTSSQTGAYGELANPEMLDIVHSVLGKDCFAFVKSGGVLPQTQLTILVPERLSKQKDDFRTLMINNASAAMDTKKWCEKVKSNLFKMYSAKAEGTPDFKIAR